MDIISDYFREGDKHIFGGEYIAGVGDKHTFV
jgi:hypothetical protein